MKKLTSIIFLAVVCGTCHAGNRAFVDPGLQVQTVVTGLGTTMATYATAFTFVDADTVLVVNRSNGEVRRVDLTGPPPAAPGPVVLNLDIISGGTVAGSEYGVQAMRLHPDFESNGYIYIRYDKSPTVGIDTPSTAVIHSTGSSASVPTTNVIERYTWQPKQNRGVGQLVWDCHIHEAMVDSRYHHGGPLVFDDGGYLFALYGELRRTGDPGWNNNTAGALLSTNTPTGVAENHGTVIRLHADGTVPTDNPFSASGIPGTQPWYAYGIRNSFGMVRDPATGDLWATDNGEVTFDEVNRIQAGMNGGWKRLSGPANHRSQTGSTASLVVLPGSTYVDPRFAWKTCIGVTALHFLHGSALGSTYDDGLLVSCINGGTLWLLRLNPTRDAFGFQHAGLADKVDDRENPFSNAAGTEAAEIVLATGLSPVLAMERGPDGWPYFLTTAGTIQRLRWIPVPGDLNDDRVVDETDRSLLIEQFGLSSSDPEFNPAADLNSDSVVNEADVALFNAILPPCPADCRPINPDFTVGDGKVSIADIIAVITGFGGTESDIDIAPANPNGTFGDGAITIADVVTVITSFGNCP